MAHVSVYKHLNLRAKGDTYADMKLIHNLHNIPQEYQSFLTAALAMAEKAGDIHMQYFRKSNLEQSTKLNDSDVVTIADKKAEAMILDFVRQHFPSHGIISEESGRDHDEREWRWVIDPIDGTTNFSAGLPAFCVSWKHNPLLRQIRNIQSRCSQWKCPMTEISVYLHI